MAKDGKDDNSQSETHSVNRHVTSTPKSTSHSTHKKDEGELLILSFHFMSILVVVKTD